MKISDYIEQSFCNLWKKKLRTFLTTSGVVIGVGALVCMFAFGQGIQKNITEQFNKVDLFNYINVSAPHRTGAPAFSFDPDDPDAGGSNRAAARTDINDREAPRLDAQFLEEARKIEGVETAFPEMRFPAQISLGDKEQFTLVQVLSADICRSGAVPFRAGRCYEAHEPNELILTDSLLRRLGEKEPSNALGREIEVATLTLDLSLRNLFQMVFSRDEQSLPFVRQSYRFIIVGVAERLPFGGMSDVYVQPEAAGTMRKLSLTSIWDFFRPASQAANYPSVTVRVRSPKYIAPVKRELESRGLRTFALLDHLEEMRTGFLVMDMFLIAVGMIGITVASLGIVNTMVMSILERYREIGIMKAVGATDGDVQRVFLFEAGMIGLMGGLFGLLLGWGVSCIINEVINAVMARQAAPRMEFFRFSWWLCLGAIGFSILVSLIAGIYPTLRAARVDPVVALRHD
jgi:putative ABC transport system permease protein